MFIVRVLVLDRISQCSIEGTSNIGTRTVPVSGNGGPNIQGARTRTVPVPGSGEPIYKVPEQENSSCSRKWGTKYTRC